MRALFVLYCLFLSMTISGSPLMGKNTQTLTDLVKILPAEVQNWKAANQGDFYDEQTIYDYMNGAGEIYKQYAFRNLFSLRYENPGNPGITLEIFDMSTSDDAYGIFSYIRSGEAINIGREGADMGAAFAFWKGNFFVYLKTELETALSRKALLELAKFVEGAIKQAGSRPAILTHLPQQNLIEKEIRYLRSFILLNFHYFIATENILQIDSTTRVVLAPYQKQDNKVHLLLIQYPSEFEAESARQNFFEHYRPGSSQSHIFQIENGKWCAAAKMKNFLSIVFDAGTKEEAAEMLTGVGM
jgi:hypothetical protein